MPDFQEAHPSALSLIDEFDYSLIVAEFDMLWARRPNDADRRRMDQIMVLIAAFEESRGKPSLS